MAKPLVIEHFIMPGMTEVPISMCDLLGILLIAPGCSSRIPCKVIEVMLMKALDLSK